MEHRFKNLLIGIGVLVLVSFLLNLNTGFVDLSFEDFWETTSQSDIAEFRVNRVLAMFLAGLAIPTSGFLLQEYFQNPLAGPSVLGVSSVASLSVALYIFLAQDVIFPEYLQNGIISIVAIIGSLILMMLLFLFSRQIRESSFLIVFGFLVSALAGALVSVLQFYADNQSLKNYILWSFGANNTLTKSQIYILFCFVFWGVFISFKTIKPLIGNAFGEGHARSLGVDVNKLKYGVILASSILSASVTAFLGPILFIGVVVPHFSRMIYNPAKLWHQWILNLLIGICVMQFFSILSEWTKFPINVMSSLFGIPMIFIILLKGKR